MWLALNILMIKKAKLRRFWAKIEKKGQNFVFDLKYLLFAESIKNSADSSINNNQSRLIKLVKLQVSPPLANSSLV